MLLCKLLTGGFVYRSHDSWLLGTLRKALCNCFHLCCIDEYGETNRFLGRNGEKCRTSWFMPYSKLAVASSMQFIDVTFLFLFPSRTPLMLAVAHGHIDAVSLLLEKEASVDAADLLGCTALHRGVTSFF